jgi:CDP-diacylglycerol--serine O-phosphatidyltransferase
MNPPRRRYIGRTVVLLPNGFTLANLFFGVFAIVAASRGDFSRAGTYIVLGGVADALDGRVARATRTGSRFGEELDSLVDAISFGLAPALIMYFAVLNQVGWDWIFCFLFTMCAVIRLARFNVEQAGRAKTYFNGLPSPAAGMTLATYYWFSQTNLYTQTVLVDLPWHQMLRYVMVGLAFLMISNVKYPAVPTIGYRTIRELVGSAIVIATIVGVIFLPKQFFFPALMAYVVWGVVRTVFLGLLDRMPGADEEEADDDDIETAQDGAPVVDDGRGPRRRRRRRRLRGGRPGPGTQHPFEEPRG